MRGSVTKYGAGWRYRVDLGPDPLTGKRRQTAKGGYSTKREAQRACSAAIELLSHGQFVKPAKRTVAEFLEEWIAGRKLTIEGTTWVGYRSYLTAYVLPSIGSTKLQDLDVARLNLLYQHLLENGRSKVDRNRLMYEGWRAATAPGKQITPRELATIGGVTYDAARKALQRYETGRLPKLLTAGLAPKTVRNIHTMLRSALADAVRLDYLVRNPAADASPPRAKRSRTQIWTPEQLRRFLDQVADDRFYALWLLVATTGLRRSELAGLRRQDVDLVMGRIESSATRVVVGGQVEDSDGKTENSVRSLALDPVTLDALRLYVQRWQEEKELFGHQGDVLFAWPDGRPIHPDTITDWFTSHAILAGLPPIRLHDVRHSYATAALRAGVPVKVVSERLGHASAAFTQDTYMHVIPGMDEHGARVAADAILGAQQVPAGAVVTNSVHPSPDTPL
ncbi:MAG: tyrosine-type recombinase/integrase [Pseudonocardiaceae bacterium]